MNKARKSITILMAHFNPSNPACINDLLERADADMYAHKQELKKRAG